jgi:hypothetical protein
MRSLQAIGDAAALRRVKQSEKAASTRALKYRNFVFICFCWARATFFPSKSFLSPCRRYSRSWQLFDVPLFGACCFVAKCCCSDASGQ